jgi:hypothetical protein
MAMSSGSPGRPQGGQYNHRGLKAASSETLNVEPFDFAVIRLRPKLRAAHGVHQLRADANGAASFAYAPLDHIARA